VESKESRFGNYLEGLRTEATKVSYRYGIRWVVGADVDGFLALAERDRQEAESRIIAFARANRDRVASSTIVNPVKAVKSFLEYYEVPLNWKKIRSELPVAQKVAMDRAPTVEEVRKLLSVCDLRMKVVTYVMISSGIRVGAFDYLRLGDLRFLESGVGHLTAYAGTPDRYNTFVSPESVDAVKEYAASREAVGEKLSPKSPLVRDKWDFEEKARMLVRSTLAPDIGVPLRSKGVRNKLGVLWVKAGVRKWGIKRGEFQQAHGFRKFFKVRASK